MSGEGLRGLFVAGGRLRAFWRILLWVAVAFVVAQVLTVVALVAGVRPGGPALLWTVGSEAILFGAGLGAGWLLLRWVERRSPGALGFALTPRTPRELVTGFALGGGIQLLAAAVLVAVGALRWSGEAGTPAAYLAELLRGLAVLFVAAAAEEVVFRGYAFQVLVESLGPVPAVVLGSLVFAAAHGANPGLDAVAFGNLVLAGVFLSLAYLKTRSLWFATAAHLGWNWVMGLALDLPVSGLRLFDTPYYDAQVRGLRWLTGGAFGPEAGVVGTLAFAAGTVWLLVTGATGEAPEMRALGPLVDSRI